MTKGAFAIGMLTAGPAIARVAGTANKTGRRRSSKAPESPEHKFEDELMAAAGQLIVKGKEHGYLTPDDILQGLPEIDAEPEQIFTSSPPSRRSGSRSPTARRISKRSSRPTTRWFSTST